MVLSDLEQKVESNMFDNFSHTTLFTVLSAFLVAVEIYQSMIIVSMLVLKIFCHILIIVGYPRPNHYHSSDYMLHLLWASDDAFQYKITWTI